MSVHLSVVFPAYNEANRIGETLWYYSKYLDAQAYDYELIVVDDGSTDNTAESVAAMFPTVKIIRYDSNQGKGYAIRTGMRAATGEFQLFSDADGSTPVEEIEKMWIQFAAGADVVIGSRSLPDSDIQVPQRFVRETMGRTFNFLVKSILGQTFVDTQCGFKGFTAESARLIFPCAIMDGFSCDPELLYIALRYGLKIAEVPVCWRNSPESRVRIWSDSFRMFLGLLEIRYNDLRGKYARELPAAE